MPHLKVWHYAPELTPEKKQLLVDAFEAVTVEILASRRGHGRCGGFR